MKVLTKTYLFGLAVLILASCKSIDSSGDLKEKLIGKWKLDSVSIPDMKFEKAGVTEVYDFKNSTDFTREWEDDDVGGTLTGKYIFYRNPKRSSATIAFISNFQISENDTIRIDIPNLDIIELNDTRLHVLEPTKFINVKGKQSIVFNKHCIYKRVE
ncbi:MAG: hypothetical protein AAGC65_03095 [Mucilaginibacter sp.]|uniref:hypothetical protein n=1 Tax=Mucilaginibacter sp. TaxID=1882438 RepID=UPI0031B162EB